jgi:UDP-N-acetylglucosamine 4-epimerase
VAKVNPARNGVEPVFGDFRAGDIRFSRADLSRATTVLGYTPEFDLSQGLANAFAWYASRGDLKAQPV